MNKRKHVWISAIILVFTLCGCGNALGGETEYTIGKQMTDRENYLDFSALDRKAQNTSAEFEIYTLEYGRFSTVTSPIAVSISSMISPIPIKASFEEGEMEFVSLEVSKYQFVKKGDVIAKVRMEIDDIDLEERNVRLTRLREEFENYVDEHTKSQYELGAQITYNEIQAQIRDLKYKRADIIYDKTVLNYRNQIKELEKQINELKKNQNLTEITAPEDGYILSVSYNRTGDKISNDQVLASYVTEGDICLEYSDTLMHYGYGMECEVSIHAGRTVLSGTGNVVSISGKQLTASWDRKSTKFKSDIAADKLLKSQDIMAFGETNVMNHVLLVPSQAVTKDGDYTYVTVLREDGKPEKRGFIAGGSNSQFYWVFDGLEEGMQIIIEQ